MSPQSSQSMQYKAIKSIFKKLENFLNISQRNIVAKFSIYEATLKCAIKNNSSLNYP
ncbi:12827_t:CDS:1, partial [Cetraspora pellucida]